MRKDVDRIKEKVDLVDTVKSYVNLSPAGKSLKGLCPFHQEKKPSFMVTPEKGIWHCFGCNEGGDVIKFIMLYENLEFPEALRFLADKAGIEIRSFNKSTRAFDILYDINESAKEFFAEKLWENKKVLGYLKKRGLQEKTIKEFELGFAPGEDALTVYLLNKKKFRLEDIKKAGLIFKNKKGLYRDRFMKRAVFPILNDVERTVAFTGRLVYESENLPKYLNSPTTPIFNKSKILYGFYKSKKHINKSSSVFLVEGQMDFLMAWQSGIKNVVAVSGSELTGQHLNKLSRFADTVLVAFDNDEGGIRALEKSLSTFGKFDFHIKAVNLGDYGDPADACLADPDFLKKSVESARPVLVHLFNHYFKGKDLGILQKKKTVRHLLRKIKEIKSSVEQDMWIKELTSYSGISQVSLQQELESLDNKKGVSTSEEIQSQNLEPQERLHLICERLCLIAFTDSDFLNILKNNSDLLPENFEEIVNNPDSEKAALLSLKAGYKMSDLDNKFLKREFEELIKNLKIETLKRQKKDLKEKIKLAGREEGDGLEDLIDNFQKLAVEIDDLKK